MRHRFCANGTAQWRTMGWHGAPIVPLALACYFWVSSYYLGGVPHKERVPWIRGSEGMGKPFKEFRSLFFVFCSLGSKNSSTHPQREWLIFHISLASW